MYKVAIDAGHGGYDTGASAKGLQEKNLTLDIAKRIQSKLRQYNGITVKMTRTTDKYISLTKRASIANNWGADAFVSIHINAGGGTGFESYIYNGNVSRKTHKLQSHIHNEVIREIGGVDRGKKRRNLAVDRQTTMPAVLTENLFIDSKDAIKLKSSKFLDRLAQGHVNGILKYFGLENKTKSNKGELSLSQYNELKGLINAQQKKIASLEKQLEKKQDKYSDSQTPSEDHAAAWEEAEKSGLLNGMYPHHPMTREQFATVKKREK